MTSIFAPLEEAFQGEVVMLPGEKKKKKSKERQFETFVPVPLQSTPDPDRPAAIAAVPPPLKGPVQAQVVKLESQGATHDLFPLPGNTAEPEEWQRAFMLGDSGAAAAVTNVPPRYVRPSGAVSVDGQPTLWRQVAAPVAPQSSPTPVPADVSARLDQLTRQLESLTSGTPMQSTAELFLFVAIGLLLLLAVDTLLRFSVSLAQRKQSGGGFMGTSFTSGNWRPAVRYSGVGGGRTWRIR
jgi:hypothetical protein